MIINVHRDIPMLIHYRQLCSCVTCRCRMAGVSTPLDRDNLPGCFTQSFGCSDERDAHRVRLDRVSASISLPFYASDRWLLQHSRQPFHVDGKCFRARIGAPEPSGPSGTAPSATAVAKRAVAEQGGATGPCRGRDGTVLDVCRGPSRRGQ